MNNSENSQLVPNCSYLQERAWIINDELDRLHAYESSLQIDSFKLQAITADQQNATNKLADAILDYEFLSEGQVNEQPGNTSQFEDWRTSEEYAFWLRKMVAADENLVALTRNQITIVGGWIDEHAASAHSENKRIWQKLDRCSTPLVRRAGNYVLRKLGVGSHDS